MNNLKDLQYRYDRAILVSGDGDFMCLAEYLNEKSKLAHIFAPNKNYSQLLGKFLPCIVRVDLLKHLLEYKKDQRRRSVETLGLSGHGDAKIVAKQGRDVNRKGNKK